MFCVTFQNANLYKYYSSYADQDYSDFSVIIKSNKSINTQFQKKKPSIKTRSGNKE